MVAHVKQMANGKGKDRIEQGDRADAFKNVSKLSQFTGNNSIFAVEELLFFKIFDKVKVRVDTTTEFPLDITCTIVFGKDDLEDYTRLASK